MKFIYFKILQCSPYLHAFICLSEEGGDLRANGGKIIEGVQVVNDEGSARLNALELFLPEIEPTSLTEFMCHSAGCYQSLRWTRTLRWDAHSG